MHLSVPQTRFCFVLFCFLTNSNNYLYQLTFSSIHCPWADSSHKKIIIIKKVVKSSVRCPVLGIFFLANLLWRGVAVNKKRESIASFSFFPPSPLFWKKTLNIDPRQRQLKLEETGNAIIKSILSSLWQNFLLFLPQMVVEQEAGKLFS